MCDVSLGCVGGMNMVVWLADGWAREDEVRMMSGNRKAMSL